MKNPVRTAALAAAGLWLGTACLVSPQPASGAGSPYVVDLSFVPVSGAASCIPVDNGSAVYKVEAEIDYVVNDRRGMEDVTAQADIVSSNPSVATMSKDGTVKGLSFGSTTITASYGGKSASWTFDVCGPSSIQFDKNTYSLSSGETAAFTLSGIYASSNGNGVSSETKVDLLKKAELSSSDPAIVTVTPAGIRAGNPGTAFITAKYAGISKQVPVYVSQQKNNLYEGKDLAAINSQTADAVAYLNKLRAGSGLVELRVNELLSKAAQAHSNYLTTAEANVKDGLNAHDEYTDQPNYVAQTPAARAKVFGYGSSDDTLLPIVGEAISFTTNENNKGVRTLIDAPYHRIILLDPAFRDVGVGINSGSEASTVISPGTEETILSVREDKTVYYPYPGQTGLPVQWKAAEVPNPLASYKKEGSVVGYPISVSIGAGSGELTFGSATITDNNGQTYDYYVTDSTKSAYNSNSVFLIPKQPLKSNTTYTVKFDGKKTTNDQTAVSVQKTWSFTTGDEPQAAGINGGGSLQINVTGESKSGASVQESQNSNPSSKTSFTDIAGHWAHDTILWAVDQRMVDGYEDGTFKPDNQVTEAEFIAMLLRVYDAKLPSGVTESTIADKHWAGAYYLIAAIKNYPAPGVSDVTKRDLPVTRTKVAEIIAGADGVNFESDAAIQYLLAKGYSHGKDDYSIRGYRGDDPITRAEAVQFILNLQTGMSELQDRPEAPTPVSELPPLE